MRYIYACTYVIVYLICHTYKCQLIYICIQDYIAANKAERAELAKRKGGSDLHTYSPEEFSLTEEQLCTGGYKSYIDRYKLPMSKN